MRTFLKTASLVLYSALICPAQLKKVLAKSPDGKWALNLEAGTVDDYGIVTIENLTTKETIETDSGPGVAAFEKASVEVTWQKSSQAFALCYQGTQRTFHSDVYFLERHNWTKAKFPPYVANILGRQGAFRTGKNTDEAFVMLRWRPEIHLVMLPRARRTTAGRGREDQDLETVHDCQLESGAPVESGHLSELRHCGHFGSPDSWEEVSI